MVIAGVRGAAVEESGVRMQVVPADEGEFSRFYLANYSLVVTTIARRTIGMNVAEDLASEVFQIAWKQYRGRGSLTLPWLYATVRNVVGAEYRRRDRLTATHQKVAADHRVASQGDPVALGEHVRVLMAQLSDGDRELLELSHWDELTTDEIAAVLEIAPGTVRVRLHRARTRLRTLVLRARDEGEDI